MDDGTVVAGEDVRRFVERLVQLEEEKAGIGESIKEVKEEAKAAGMDMKALAVVVRERLKDTREEGQQTRENVDAYHEAL